MTRRHIRLSPLFVLFFLLFEGGAAPAADRSSEPSTRSSKPTTVPSDTRPAEKIADAKMAIQSDDCVSRMELATFKFFNRTSTATCFLVKPPVALGLNEKQRVLVTAGHVFERMTGEEAILVLRSAHADGSFSRRDFPVKIRDGQTGLWTHHPKMDVAAMLLALPDDVTAEPIEFESLADEPALKLASVHVGSDLFILTYPMRIEANPAGFPVVRHGSIASFPLTPVQLFPTFEADFTTFAGDSGGPVIVCDHRSKTPAGQSPLVLGIVISEIREDEKMAMLNEERTVHVPMNLGNAVQARFVRETIAMLKR